MPLLFNIISTAQLYAVNTMTEDSALFMIEGKVLKLRNF